MCLVGLLVEEQKRYQFLALSLWQSTRASISCQAARTPVMPLKCKCVSEPTGCFDPRVEVFILANAKVSAAGVWSRWRHTELCLLQCPCPKAVPVCPS